MQKLLVSTLIIAALFLSSITAKAQQTYCPPNIDFENGGFSYWICNVGAVTPGTTGNPAILTYPINPTGPSVTQHILKSSGLDTFGQFPTTCNYINGNHFSVRLGDDQVNATCARMRYKLNVPTNNNHYSLTFYYALVFENPRHTIEAQPGFRVTIIDSATNLPANLCSNFSVVQPTNGGINGFSMTLSSQFSDTVYYRNWTASTLNFSGLAGKTIYLQFDAFDCAFGAHFGYAYIDFPDNCIGSAILQTANCTSSNIPHLIAPGGYSAYQWYDSSFTNLLSTNDTLTISTTPIDTSLHYCVLIPFNNWGCMDTVSAKYNPNPAAVADFNYPSSYCVNSVTHFIDNSYTTISGAYINKWAWNFGDANASLNNPNTNSIQNPTHIYSAMGNYTVCLIAHSNINCLADTICQTININRITPIVNLNFTKDSICGFTDTTTVYSTQSASAGCSYQWILDANTILVSGSLNSLHPIVLLFKTIGNHIVQLNSIPSPLDTNCATTSTTQIYVKALTPTFGFNALDSVCSNTPVSLSVNSLPTNSGATSAACSILSQINIGSNNGTTQNGPTIFNGLFTESKVQILYTKAELNAAGFYGGIISKLAWNILIKNSSQPFQGFSIKMAAVNYPLLGNIIDTSIPLTLVYSSSAYSSALGINQFNLNTNYSWNGNSNLLIEVCFDNGTSNWSGDDLVSKSIMSSIGFCNWARSDNDPLTGCDKHYTGNITYTSTERPDLSLFYCNAGPLSSNNIYSWSSNPVGISANTSSIADTINATKTYTVSVTDNGCASTQNHTIKIASIFNDQISVSLCIGSVYTFNGKTYTATGIYFDTISSNNGCDTITQLNLMFNYRMVQLMIQICQGSIYNFNGKFLSLSGSYIDTTHHINSCDTLFFLQLNVIDSITNITGVLCGAGANYNFNNKILSTPGIYNDTAFINACMTITRLHLILDTISNVTYIIGDTIFAVEVKNTNTYQWRDCNLGVIQNTNTYFYHPLFSGWYSVDIYSMNCWASSNCIYFNANCIAHYSTDYDTLNNTFIVTVDTVTAQQAISYLWNFGDGTTSTSATPTHVYTVDTTYNLCLQIITANNDTCSYCHIVGKDYQGHIIKNAGFTINIKNPLLNGVENNLTHENHFSIYPNPVSQSLVISSQQLVNTVEITDVLGRVLKTISNIQQSKSNIEVGELPNGVYFIKLIDKNGNAMNGKFVKQ